MGWFTPKSLGCKQRNLVINIVFLSFIIPVMKKGRSVGRRRYHAGPQSVDPAWLSLVDNVVNSADVDLPKDPIHPSSEF